MHVQNQTPDARHAGIAAGVGVMVIVLVSLTLTLLMSWYAMATGGALPSEGDPLFQALGLPLQQIVLGLLALWMARMSTDGTRAALALGRGRRGWLALLVVPAGLLSDRAVALARWVDGSLALGLERGGLETLQVAVTAPGWVGLSVVFGAAVCAPVAEELLFRGYIFRGLTRSSGWLAAIGGSALIFGLYHLDPIHIAGVLVIGVWLGWLRWVTGALWPCVVAHVLNNVIWIVSVRAGWDWQPPGWVYVLAGVSVSVGVVWAGRDTS